MDAVKAMERFRFCPQCGEAGRGDSSRGIFGCAACGFHYHHNAAAAAGAILVAPDGRLLLLRRAKEPARGKLALPGGFVDAGESAEEALRREVREELGVEIASLRYLGSYPNTYPYRGISYSTVDAFFEGKLDSLHGLRASEEVAGVCLLRREEIDPEEIAFVSVRRGIEDYLRECGY